MKIIFDLDGTLLDASTRMYELFQRLVPESHFTKEQYWNLKRDKVNHKMILERYFHEINYDDFNRMWLNMIEQKEYLNRDCIYPDTMEVLSLLKKKKEDFFAYGATIKKKSL